MFKLTIATPEKRVVYDQEVDEVVVPGFRGELDILPGHAPLITTLGSGTLVWKFSHSGHISKAAISWGYCQVSPVGVNILAEIVDRPEEIEIKGVEDSIRILESKMLNNVLNDEEYLKLAKSLQVERSRQRLINEKTHN